MEKIRDKLLDNLRGLAVLLMVLAHSIVFFNSASDPLLFFISQFSDTVVFTIFLFVSGAASYLSYLKVDARTWKQKKQKLVLRVFRLTIAYYLVALLATIPEFVMSAVSMWPVIVQELIILIKVPSYTEFVIPFIIYSLLIIGFRKFFKSIADNYLLVIVVSVVAFWGGTLLHTRSWPDPLFYYTSLFFGYRDLFRFPVLQYLPVFLLGMVWGSYHRRSKRSRSVFVLVMLTISSLIYIVCTYTSYTVNREKVYDTGFLLQRWPPSLAFISFGLAFIFFCLIVVRMSRVLVTQNVIKGTLSFFGENAFLFYFYHIIILYIYRYTLNIRVSSPVMVFIAYTGLLIVCSQLVLWLKRVSHSNKFIFDDLNLKKILQSKITVIVLIAILTVSIIYLVNRANWGNIQTGRSVTGVEGIFLQERDPYWWNSSYKYNRNFLIVNEDRYAEITPEDVVLINIDHAQLVSNGKSKTDGSDIAVVYFDNGSYQQLPIKLSQTNNKNSEVLFRPVKGLSSNFSDDKYFLYYGADTAEFKSADIEKSTVQNSFEFKAEIAAQISTIISRKWILKDIKLAEDFRTSHYEINVSNIDLHNAKLRCLIKGTEQAMVTPEAKEDGTYVYTIDANKFSPGTYTIQAVIEGTNFKSAVSEFYVSYPLYVTWSLDYEGFDVSNKYLDSIAKISTDYGVPVTHLFNPRIFIAAEISPKRRQELVNWVLQRQTLGDEIGMHMHMHYDMIEAAGIKPITEPRWGGRLNGHDVLTSVYDYHTFTKLVVWAKNQFVKNRLPEPKTYRAGGWFIDIENLQVLQDQGFLIDTSGREFHTWGPNKISVPWHLDSTTRPYHPSLQDQNTNTIPTLTLWEFPNNGQDSTNNPAGLLLTKFDENFNGQPLKTAQALSYLSHPHWFDTYDSPKIKSLFNKIERFTTKKDNGPVIFVTYMQALKEWE